jgi:hypothetical protein
MTERLFYKYVTAERIDVLKNNCVRFTQPEALNDPFESMPCLTMVKQDSLRRLHAKMVATAGSIGDEGQQEYLRNFVEVVIEGLFKQMGMIHAFLSVSEIFDSLLMWSHYTEAHTGFVMGFAADCKLFAPENLSRHGLKPVEYSTDRLVFPASGYLGMSYDEMVATNTHFLFTKSVEWRYEREHRVLAMPRDADKTISTDPPIYLFDFPPQSIRTIIFGYRMSALHCEEIARLAKDKYPWASLVQAQLDEHKFGLRFGPYSEHVRHCGKLAEVRKQFNPRIPVEEYLPKNENKP